MFSKINATSGYWKVETGNRDEDKQALTLHHGLFSFVQMQFGTRNAPKTSQRTIHVALSTAERQSALVYFHDIVFYVSAVEHIALGKHM